MVLRAAVVCVVVVLSASVTGVEGVDVQPWQQTGDVRHPQPSLGSSLLDAAIPESHSVARVLLQQAFQIPAGCNPQASPTYLLTNIIVTDTLGRSTSETAPGVLAGLAEALGVDRCSISFSPAGSCEATDASPAAADASSAQEANIQPGASTWTVEGCTQASYDCGAAGSATPAEYTAALDSVCFVNRKLGSAICGGQTIAYAVFTAITSGSCKRSCLDTAPNSVAATHPSCSLLALSIAANNQSQATLLASLLGSAKEMAQLDSYLLTHGLASVQVPSYTPAEVVSSQRTPAPASSYASAPPAGAAGASGDHSFNTGPVVAPSAAEVAPQLAPGAADGVASHSRTAAIESVMPSQAPNGAARDASSLLAPTPAPSQAASHALPGMPPISAPEGSHAPQLQPWPLAPSASNAAPSSGQAPGFQSSSGPAPFSVGAAYIAPSGVAPAPFAAPAAPVHGPITASSPLVMAAGPGPASASRTAQHDAAPPVMAPALALGVPVPARAPGSMGGPAPGVIMPRTSQPAAMQPRMPAPGPGRRPSQSAPSIAPAPMPDAVVPNWLPALSQAPTPSSSSPNGAPGSAGHRASTGSSSTFPWSAVPAAAPAVAAATAPQMHAAPPQSVHVSLPPVPAPQLLQLGQPLLAPSSSAAQAPQEAPIRPSQASIAAPAADGHLPTSSARAPAPAASVPVPHSTPSSAAVVHVGKPSAAPVSAPNAAPAPLVAGVTAPHGGPSFQPAAVHAPAPSTGGLPRAPTLAPSVIPPAPRTQTLAAIMQNGVLGVPEYASANWGMFTRRFGNGGTQSAGQAAPPSQQANPTSNSTLAAEPMRMAAAPARPPHSQSAGSLGVALPGPASELPPHTSDAASPQASSPASRYLPPAPQPLQVDVSTGFQPAALGPSPNRALAAQPSAPSGASAAASPGSSVAIAQASMPQREVAPSPAGASSPAGSETPPAGAYSPAVLSKPAFSSDSNSTQYMAPTSLSHAATPAAVGKAATAPAPTGASAARPTAGTLPRITPSASSAHSPASNSTRQGAIEAYQPDADAPAPAADALSPVSADGPTGQDAAGLGPSTDAGPSASPLNGTAGINGGLRNIQAAGVLPGNSHLMLIVYTTIGGAVGLALLLTLLAAYLYKRNSSKPTHLVMDAFDSLEDGASPASGHVTSPLGLRRAYMSPFQEAEGPGAPSASTGPPTSPVSFAAAFHSTTQHFHSSPGGNPLRGSWPVGTAATMDGPPSWRPPPRLDLSALRSSMSMGQLSRGPITLVNDRPDSADGDGTLRLNLASTYLLSPAANPGRQWRSPGQDGLGRVFCNPMYNASPTSNNTRQSLEPLQHRRGVANITPSSRFQPMATAADSATPGPDGAAKPAMSPAVDACDSSSEGYSREQLHARPCQVAADLAADVATDDREAASSSPWHYAVHNATYAAAESSEEPASPGGVHLDILNASPPRQAHSPFAGAYMDPRTGLPMTPKTRELTRVRMRVAAMEAEMRASRQALESPSRATAGLRSPGSPAWGRTPHPADAATPPGPAATMGHASPASFGPRNPGQTDAAAFRHSTWAVPSLPMDSPDRPPLRPIATLPSLAQSSSNRPLCAGALHYGLSAASSPTAMSFGQGLPISPTFAVMQREEDAATPCGEVITSRPTSRAEDAPIDVNHAAMHHAPTCQPHMGVPAVLGRPDAAGHRHLRHAHAETPQSVNQPAPIGRHAAHDLHAGKQHALQPHMHVAHKQHVHRELQRLDTQESVLLGQENLPWMAQATNGGSLSAQSLPGSSEAAFARHGSGSVYAQDVSGSSPSAKAARQSVMQVPEQTPKRARQAVNTSLEEPEACGTPISGRRQAGRNQFHFQRAALRTARSVGGSYIFVESPPPRARRRSADLDACLRGVQCSVAEQAQQRAALNAALTLANSHIQPQTGSGRTPHYKVVMFHQFPEARLRDWFHQHHIRDDQVEVKFLPTPSATSFGSALS